MVISAKTHVQDFLKRIGLYQRLKGSSLYRIYWSLVDRSVIEEEEREVAFYRSLLTDFRQGDCIFDIGANHGFKTAIFLQLGAKVVAVDPDETNVQILKDKFLKFRLKPKPVDIVHKAVSDKDAVETMWIEKPGSAKNTFSKKWVDALATTDVRFGYALHFDSTKEISTVTAEQLFATYGVPLFVKIDVEGYELNVLKGMQRPVPYLSFEVNLPEFKLEGVECVAILGSLAPKGKFNYVFDLRQGLALQKWVEAGQFSKILEECSHSSIEVFWKTVP